MSDGWCEKCLKKPSLKDAGGNYTYVCRECDLPNSEKLKVIVNEYVAGETGGRSWDEVHAHMTDWANKGHLSQSFIDDCYGAIKRGLHVVFTYNPGKTYGFLAGDSEELVREVLQQVEAGNVEYQDASGKLIERTRKRNPFFDKWRRK